nr:uncharacterized protein LOC118878298 [Drosophila suzukii]
MLYNNSRKNKNTRGPRTQDPAPRILQQPPRLDPVCAYIFIPCTYSCLAQGTPFQDAGRRTQDPGQRVTAGVYCPAPAPANGGALEHWRTWPGK